jgi:PAS domain-containing protein
LEVFYVYGLTKTTIKMTILIYLIAGIAVLSGINLLIDHSTYWDEIIALLQASLALLSLYSFFKKIARPIKWIDKKSEMLKNGNLEIGNDRIIDQKEFQNVNHVLNSMSLNTRNAIEFIKNIEEGKLDFEYSYNGSAHDSEESNKLAQSLVNLRDTLNEIAVSEKERNWTTEGLARFVEILRANNEDIQSLSDKILSNLVNYVKANQGQLYILNDDDSENTFLELSAFYAFDRKKFIEKSIQVGQGLVGQAYQEKETILLTEVPDNYVKVTSGLGEANPRCILIVPLKINDVVYGILELASFNAFKAYEIDFVEKIGESIASTVSNAKVNHKTKVLLEDLQQQQEEMKAQEEEMRQNMEELQATQEEMSRKEKEISRLFELSNAKEKELEQQLKEIENMAGELEMENAMFTSLMDILTERITIKDKNSNYLRLNKTKADALRKQGIENAVGQSDRDFFGEEHFKKAYSVEKAIMDSGQGVFNQEEKIVMPDGSHWWASNSRIPFKNKEGGILGTMVVTKDITKEKEYLVKLEEAKAEIERLKKQ